MGLRFKVAYCFLNGGEKIVIGTQRQRRKLNYQQLPGSSVEFFLVHSFYEEISPQEWKMIEKEARKVKGEINRSFKQWSLIYVIETANFPPRRTST